MSDQIKVAVRVRPLIDRESASNCGVHWGVREDSIFELDPSRVAATSTYTYDHVFGSSSSNGQIFGEAVQPIVESAMLGYNGTIFAYGQTSSGKTYTVMGTGDDAGVIPLAVDAIFNTIDASTDRQYLLRVSYLEIYKEDMFDLLTGQGELKIREKPSGEVFVANLDEQIVSTPEQILDHLFRGQDRRRVGETNMNERSSRSHTIFRIVIESREQTSEAYSNGAVSVSQLNIVDLAGSERASQTGARGERLKEGAAINQSLSSLARVIMQLSDNEDFVSFRDSRLTRILKNSLGGNAKTVIICNVTPAAIDETHSTLKFASRAKRIQNKPVKNEVLTDEALLRRYQREICTLRAQVDELKSESNVEVLQIRNDELNREIEQNREKLERLGKLILSGGAAAREKTPAKFHALKSRRQTWCPGLGKPLVSPLALKRSSAAPTPSTSAPVDRSFESRGLGQVLSELDEVEKERLSDFSAEAAASPRTQSVPRKRARFAAQLETVAESVGRLSSPPPPPVSTDADCQTLPPFALAKCAHDVSELREIATKLRVAIDGSLTAELEKLAIVERQLADERCLVEQLSSRNAQLQDQLSAAAETPSVADECDDLTVGLWTKSGVPKQLLDPNLDETVVEDTNILNLMLGDASYATAPEDPAETTLCAADALASVSPPPDAVELKMRQLHDEMVALRAENERMRTLLEGGLSDEIRQEVERIMTDNARLSAELQQLRDAAAAVDEEAAAAETWSHDAGCATDSPLKLVDRSVLAILASPRPLPSPAAETPSASASASAESLQDVATLTKRLDDAVRERNEALLIAEKLLADKESRQDNYKDRCDALEAQLQLQWKEAVAEARDSLAARDVSLADLQSFHARELEAVDDARIEKNHLEERCHRLEADVTFLKAQIAECVGVEDFQSWKKTSEDAESLTREVKAQLIHCQSALKDETIKYSNLNAAFEKERARAEKSEKDAADFEWMLDFERKKLGKKVDELQSQIRLMMAEAPSEPTQSDGANVSLQTSLLMHEPAEMEELEKALEERSRLVERLESDAESHRVQLLTLQSLNTHLAADIDAKAEQLADVTGQLATVREERDTLASFVKAEQTRWEEAKELLNRDVIRLETELRDAAVELSEARRRPEAAAAAANTTLAVQPHEPEATAATETQTEPLPPDARVAELTVALRASDAAADMLRQEVQQLREVSREQLQQAEELTAARVQVEERLSVELNELRRRLDALNQSAHEAEVAKLDQIRSLNDQIVALKENEAATEQVLAQLGERATRGETETARLASVEAMLRTSKRRLEKECDDADRTEADLRQQLDGLRAQCAELQEAAATATTVQQWSTAEAAWREKTADLERRLRDAEATVEQQRMRLNEEGQRGANVERRLTNDMRALKAELNSLKKDVDYKDQKVCQLKNEIRTIREQAEECTVSVGRPSSLEVGGLGRRTGSLRDATVTRQAASGGGIVDSLMIQEERQKNYKLTKQVQELEKKIDALQLELLGANELVGQLKARTSAAAGARESDVSSTSAKENSAVAAAAADQSREPATPRTKRSILTPSRWNSVKKSAADASVSKPARQPKTPSTPSRNASSSASSSLRSPGGSQCRQQ